VCGLLKPTIPDVNKGGAFGFEESIQYLVSLDHDAAGILILSSQ
jgi:hypothetical protein